jgi:hypothetical protein
VPNASNPFVPQFGNGSSDFPPGTTDWTGFTPISSAPESWAAAQLWAAPGANAPINSLQPALAITTFRSGADAGFINGLIATLGGVPADAPVATLQLRVWDTRQGTITSWQAAMDFASTQGILALGASHPFNVMKIGGVLNSAPTLDGLTSFSLVLSEPAPEPSSTTLLGLAICLMWLRHKVRR